MSTFTRLQARGVARILHCGGTEAERASVESRAKGAEGGGVEIREGVSPSPTD